MNLSRAGITASTDGQGNPADDCVNVTHALETVAGVWDVEVSPLG
jgi:hypothetical protein